MAEVSDTQQERHSDRLPVRIEAIAVVVNTRDNVAVVKTLVPPGILVKLSDGRIVEIRTQVPPGHRFALVDIPKDSYVLQYGQPIGTSMGVRAGEAVSHENMKDDVPIVRGLPDDLFNPDWVEDWRHTR